MDKVSTLPKLNNFDLSLYWAMIDNEYKNQFQTLLEQYGKDYINLLSSTKKEELKMNRMKNRFSLIISGSYFRAQRKAIKENSLLFKIYIFDSKSQLHEDLLDDEDFKNICVVTNDIGMLCTQIEEEILELKEHGNEFNLPPIYCSVYEEEENDFLYNEVDLFFPRRKVVKINLAVLIEDPHNITDKDIILIISDSEPEENIEFINECHFISNFLVYNLNETDAPRFITKCSKFLAQSKNIKTLNEIIKNIKIKSQINEQKNPLGRNFIEIENNSPNTVFIRVSSKNSTDDFLKKVESKKSLVWYRDYGKVFDVHFERTNHVRDGPIYRIQIGRKYYIDKTSQFRSENGDLMRLSEFEFEENINEDDANFTFNNRTSLQLFRTTSVTRNNTLAKLKTITLNNKSDDTIKINLNEYNVEIKPLGKYFFKVLDGRYIINITTNIGTEDEFTQRHYVHANMSYSLIVNEDDIYDLILDNNDKIIYTIEELEDLDQDDIDEDKEGTFTNKDYNYYNDQIPDYTENEPYMDPYFPPDENSLKGYDSEGNKVKPHFMHLPPQEEEVAQAQFFEPNEIFFGKTYELFEDSISINDIIQGNIANCYLMSIIASMGRWQYLIEDIFCSKKTNLDGFYQIFYYEKTGEKKIIFVDHYLPCFVNRYGRPREPLGSKPHGQEIWVAIIEKAFAKYEGGYANIFFGRIIDELYWLTGSYCQNLDLTHKHSWNNLKIVIQREHVVCCTSKASSKEGALDSDRTQNNIVTSHAYSILNADEYKGLKLLTLRNPYGETEWTGKYSDNSECWTPELKEYFSFDDFARGENGIFFIEFEDFKSVFTDVIICFC